MELLTPRQAAIKLIEHYVLRGDNLHSLRSGQLFCSCEEFRAGISGFLSGKKYGSDKIVVSRINGKECEEVFDLADIFNLIKNEGGEQKQLF